MLEKDNQSQTDQAAKKMDKHFSRIFVVMGIISFAMSTVIGYYTIKRIKSQ